MAIYHLRLVFSAAGSEGKQQYGSHEIVAVNDPEAVIIAKRHLDDDDERLLHIAMLFASSGAIIWSLRASGAELPPAVAPAS